MLLCVPTEKMPLPGWLHPWGGNQGLRGGGGEAPAGPAPSPAPAARTAAPAGAEPANLRFVRSDAEFARELERSPDVVVEFATRWCTACQSMVPTMRALSRRHPHATFLVVECEDLPATTRHMRYTPTFRFYKAGARTDECIGADHQALQDHAWLHLAPD